MPGIQRIKIKSDWNDNRIKLSDNHITIANDLYSSRFDLKDGYENIIVSKEEAMARYDWKEGIDVILTLKSGSRLTLQEKILTYHKPTLTIEDTKTNGDPGAWYYCTADLYMVAYNYDYEKTKRIKFDDFVIVNLPTLKLIDADGLINWRMRKNSRDNRRSTFRYLPFDEIPPKCIVLMK